LAFLGESDMTKEIEMIQSKAIDAHSEHRPPLETPQWHTAQILHRTAETINSDSQKNATTYPLPKLSIDSMFGATINNSFFKKHLDTSKGRPKPTEKPAREDAAPERTEAKKNGGRLERSSALEPIDPTKAERYLHGDGKGLPPISKAFKDIGLETLAAATAKDSSKPQIHVSTRPGDKAFPLGSKENPYTSIQSAVDKAPTGSVINVHRVASDVYKERVSVTRSDLVLQTDARNPAVLDLAGKTTGRANAAFAIGSGSSEISIKNFEIRNFTGNVAAIRIDGSNIHNITVAGNDIHSASGAEGIAVYGRGGSEASRLSKINIISNKVHDLKLGELEAIPINGNVSGFKVVGNSGYKLDNIFIDTIGGEGVSKNATFDQARNGEISFNYADKISTQSNPNSSESGNLSAAAIYSDGAKNLSIRNNYIRNADFGIEIGGEHAGLASSNVAVSSNVVEASNYVWLGRGGAPQRPGGARDSYARDNVVIGNARTETQSNVRNFAVENTIAFARMSSTKVLPKDIAALVQKLSK